MQQIVDAAQRWLGTPFVHQASQCHYGCDCLGLIRGIWREVIGQEPCDIPHYDVGRLCDRQARLLETQLDCWFFSCAFDFECAGSVIGFSLGQGKGMNHLGILTGQSMMIHAHCRHGVIEGFVNHPWQSRVVAQYHFPI